MKDLLNLKMEIKNYDGELRLSCEDTDTGNFVIFKQYIGGSKFSGFARWEPSMVCYDTMSYTIEEYTKIVRYGIYEEETNQEIIDSINQFIKDVVYTYDQLKFVGMLGLNEPKRM